MPTSSIAESVHANLEGLCVACHGGDRNDPTKRAHDPSTGFKGKPTPEEVPNFCGGCHSDPAFMRRFSATLAVDQLALYRSSGHGKALTAGEAKAATCVSCHGSHNIKHITDTTSPVYAKNVAKTCGKCHSDREHPSYKKTKLDPVPLWRRSVHAAAMYEKGDASAPTCNDCHGDHGATPPGVQDIHRTCGRCHAEQSELFEKSAHFAAYRRLGFGECKECHNEHDVQAATSTMLTTSEQGVCRRCHREGDKGWVAAAALYERIGGAEKVAAAVRASTASAKAKGLLIPDADAADKELYTAIKRLKIGVHNLKPEALDEQMKTIHGIADRIGKSVTERESELTLRRRGYIAFIVLIGIVVVLLAVKARRLKR